MDGFNFPHIERACERPLIIDSFAGGGGASTGIERALGSSPDYAINHDAHALSMHQANHPNTAHLSKNVWHVDPLDVVGRRRVGLAWFSPDCKHFSKAKGGKPVSRAIRDLAWIVVLWAKRVRPAVIMVENVEEFKQWGPISESGQPCKVRSGQTFDKWVRELRRLGYRVEWRELRACDYGAPTIRKRLFVIARCDGKPIVWPAPTHAKDGLGGLAPWRTAAEIIDWSIPCPSIFDSAGEIWEKHGLRSVRPLAENTLRRIAAGVKRYVIDAGDPFLVTYAQHGGAICAGGGHSALIFAFLTKYYGTGGGASVGDPLPTTTTHDRFGLVTVKIDGADYVITDIGMRMLTPRELFAAQGFPLEYRIEHGADGHAFGKTAQVSKCGNAVPPPLAEALVKANCQHLCERPRGGGGRGVK